MWVRTTGRSSRSSKTAVLTTTSDVRRTKSIRTNLSAAQRPRSTRVHRRTAEQPKFEHGAKKLPKSAEMIRGRCSIDSETTLAPIVARSKARTGVTLDPRDVRSRIERSREAHPMLESTTKLRAALLWPLAPANPKVLPQAATAAAWPAHAQFDSNRQLVAAHWVNSEHLGPERLITPENSETRDHLHG